MMKRTLTPTIAAALLALTLGLAGCRTHTVHHVGGGPAPPPAARVVIAKGHVHTAHCGHYRHGSHWYLVKGHRHGPGCGHVRVKGVWIVRP